MEIALMATHGNCRAHEVLELSGRQVHVLAADVHLGRACLGTTTSIYRVKQLQRLLVQVSATVVIRSRLYL